MDRFEFAMLDGLAHLCERGNCWSLCGRETRQTVRGAAVPCQTCLTAAGERVAADES